MPQLIPHNRRFEQLSAGARALLLIQSAKGLEFLHSRYRVINNGNLVHLITPLRGLQKVDNVIPCSRAGLLLGLEKGFLALLFLQHPALLAFLVGKLEEGCAVVAHGDRDGRVGQLGSLHDHHGDEQWCRLLRRRLFFVKEFSFSNTSFADSG